MPSSGLRAAANLDYVAESPDAPPESSSTRSNDDVTQFEVRGSMFWSRRQSDRVFLYGGLGTTSGHPLATEQFQLGEPLRLGAYDVGELRGDHYGVITAGYLRGIGRLPDFLGGPIYLAAGLKLAPRSTISTARD